MGIWVGKIEDAGDGTGTADGAADDAAADDAAADGTGVADGDGDATLRSAASTAAWMSS